MNYLAHIYLSGDDPGVILGNFMADGIKGKKYLKYPPTIQKGILLHRFIDSYTDAHPTFKQSTKRLHENYGHYSGVIVDILYDHFLANNWSEFSDIPLEQYSQEFYELLNDNYEVLPSRIQKMMPYMIADNWLLSYASIKGIGRILYQMNQRTKNRSKMNFAILELEKYYEEFEAEFRSFFNELQQQCKQKLATL
ncbi:MAG: acyl carrier protein phosphodiesterase [Gilvibacter sp.]